MVGDFAGDAEAPDARGAASRERLEVLPKARDLTPSYPMLVNRRIAR
jgi:hypothetical protein